MKKLNDLLVERLIVNCRPIDTLSLSTVRYIRDRELEYLESRRNIDLTLDKAVALSITKGICDCPRCEGKQYKVKWEGMNIEKWGESACPYSVGLHKAKIAISRGGQFDVEKWNTLIERTLVDKE
jgi:hypothetical protein